MLYLTTYLLQLMWLVRMLVRSGIGHVEGVVWCLLRQMAGGDVSPRNIWLAESLCDLLRDQRSVMESHKMQLIPESPVM